MENCRFPVEIMMNILPHLPIKSMIRFRCVCKSWFRLFTAQTSDPYFTQLHASQLNIENPNPVLIPLRRDFNRLEYLQPDFNRPELPSKFFFASDYTQIDNPIELKEPNWYINEYIYGISKGLVCLISSYLDCDVINIWNPITRDNITIPTPPPLHDESNKRNRRDDYGFGFCEATNEYKVVRIIISSLGRTIDKYDYQCHANVFTLGTNTWRVMEDVLLDVHTRYWKSGRKVVNGVVHWLAEKKSAWMETIISFDLAREKFKEILLPEIANYLSRDVHVEELSGMLAIIYKDMEKNFRIWVMKDYGVHDSWTELFTIRKSQIPWCNYELKLLGVANDGNIMMFNHDVLVLFNTETNSIRTHKCFCPDGFLPLAYVYNWSLISPRYITVLKPNAESEDNEQERKTCS